MQMLKEIDWHYDKIMCDCHLFFFLYYITCQIIDPRTRRPLVIFITSRERLPNKGLNTLDRTAWRQVKVCHPTQRTVIETGTTSS